MFDPVCGDPQGHKFPFCSNCYDMSRWAFTERPMREEGTPVKHLILCDNFDQAIAYARVHRFSNEAWQFIQGRSVIDAYPNAQVHCISAELFREDLHPLLDHLTTLCRYVDYEE